MKKLLLITIAALAFAGCNAATKTDNSKPAAEASPAKSEAPKTETAAEKSPTETMVAFVEGLKKKDSNSIKETLSKTSLEQLEKAAAEDKTTIDEIISAGEDMSKENTPEMKDEKIDGDSATIQVQDEKTKKWDTVPFVKEDGKWKIAMDKMKM
jgi:PBP1b-binding outer membrane lipoprotein LpoB